VARLQRKKQSGHFLSQKVDSFQIIPIQPALSNLSLVECGCASPKYQKATCPTRGDFLFHRPGRLSSASRTENNKKYILIA
jgi:hypothetical protein